MMRYVILLSLFIAAGCSSSTTDDAAKKAKAAGQSAASAASAAAKSAASAAKATVKSAAAASAKPASAPSAAAAPAGVGDNARLVGQWKFDMASLENDPRLAKMEGEAKKKAMEQTKAMMGQMTTEFTKDGKLIMALNPQMKMEGTYKVLSVTGNAAKIQTTMKQGANDKTETVDVTFDGAKLRLKGPGGQEIIFTK